MYDVAQDAGLQIDPAAAHALSEGSVGDPFALLGPHQDSRGVILRAYLPGAHRVEALTRCHRVVRAAKRAHSSSTPKRSASAVASGSL